MRRAAILGRVDTYHLVSLFTCAGHIALAAIAFQSSASRPIGRVLGLLSLTLFTWNAADVAADLSSLPIWQRIDEFAAALTMPFVLHFLALFLARSRRWIWIAYAYFFGIAVFGTVYPPFRGNTWALAVLAGVTPTFIVAVWRLTVHLSRSTSSIERARTRLVLMAIVFGVVFGVSDLGRILDIPVPRLSNVGTFVGVVLLGVATWRFRLLDTNIDLLEGVVGAGLAFGSFGAYALLFGSFGSDLGMLAVATSVITFVAIRYARAAAIDRSEESNRVAYHTTLGRFAHQMAHDLRNPIAVAKGAVQFLAQERAEGRSIDAHDTFLTLVETQLDQMERSLADYERLGRVQIARQKIDVVALVRDTCDGMGVQARKNATVELDARIEAVTASLDPDLLVPAVENLIRNAIESTEENIAIRVVVDQEGSDVKVAVEDDGPGMSPRTADRALDDFFTTKATGSGLGLALVRRVAEAHGGRAEIESAEGVGTKVTLWLPTK